MGSIAQWKSLQWPDGTLYEGIIQDEECCSAGVIQFPNGDRYEGEFLNNKMHGSGVYIWGDGMLYRGEWKDGLMHGCGVKMWKEAQSGVGEIKHAAGRFFADDYVGPLLSCSVDGAREAAVDADVAAMSARHFQTDYGRKRRQEIGEQLKKGQLPGSYTTTNSTKATSMHQGQPPWWSWLTQPFQPQAPPPVPFEGQTSTRGASSMEGLGGWGRPVSATVPVSNSRWTPDGLPAGGNEGNSGISSLQPRLAHAIDQMLRDQLFAGSNTRGGSLGD